MSFDKLVLFDDESNDDESRSGSPGTCDFPFYSDEFIDSVCKSVGRVSGVGFDVFLPTGINSIGDVVLLVMFVPRGVKSKGGRLIECFWRPKY